VHVAWVEVTRRLECFWVGGSGSRLLTTWASPHGMDTLPPDDPGEREKPVVFRVLAQRWRGLHTGVAARPSGRLAMVGKDLRAPDSTL